MVRSWTEARWMCVEVELGSLGSLRRARMRWVCAMTRFC